MVQTNDNAVLALFNRETVAAGRSTCNTCRHQKFESQLLLPFTMHASLCFTRSTWRRPGLRVALARNARTVPCASVPQEGSTRQLALQKPSSQSRFLLALAHADTFHFKRNVKACGQNDPGPPVMHEDDDDIDGYDDAYYAHSEK